MVKIAFVLPVPNRKIIGGYKVVYEYANYLVAKGCDITIVYNAHNGDNSMHLPRSLVFLIRWIIGTFGPKWFILDQRIHKKVFPIYKKNSFDDFDIVIATACETAEYVQNAQNEKLKKWYFVQDFENWGRSKDDVLNTFKMDMNIITISKWLKKIIDGVSCKEAVYIPNGIDKNIFTVKIPYNNRGEHTLSTLYHWDERKGCDVALQVIFRLKEKYPDFEAYLFGVPKRENSWPDWIHYNQKATPQEVCDTMNNARVFLCTSRQEGFGLTGLESIFCGCTLVTTDCMGIREYASEQNSYLCKVDDKEELFKSVCCAFDNKEQIIYKKKNCNELIIGFDAEYSKELFYKTIVHDYR